MKIIKDTQLMEDPNDFGEAIREYAFIPENQRGCYSTFDLKPEFRKVKKDCKLGKLLLSYLGLNEKGEVDNGDYGVEAMNSSLYSNGTVHLAWYWDGDGILVIMEGKKVAVNGDCKKSYGWEWV